MFNNLKSNQEINDNINIDNINIDKINIKNDDTDMNLKSQQFIKYLNNEFQKKNMKIEPKIKEMLTPQEERNLPRSGNYNKLNVLFPGASFFTPNIELKIKPVEISYTVNENDETQSFIIDPDEEIFAGFAQKYYKYKLKYLILKKLKD